MNFELPIMFFLLFFNHSRKLEISDQFDEAIRPDGDMNASHLGNETVL